MTEEKTTTAEADGKVETAELPEPRFRASIIYGVACVPESWTADEMERFANRDSPTGISSRWRAADAAVVEEQSGGDYSTNPLPCLDDGRMRHWLVSC